MNYTNKELPTIGHAFTVQLSVRIETINDQYWYLRAEEIPEKEKNLGPGDHLVHVYHFTSQPRMQVQNFGVPFFVFLHEEETLGALKLRIQKKLQVPDEEFANWKFAFLSFGRAEYLQDSDIVSRRFRNVYGIWDLGVEHSDSSPEKRHKPSQNLQIG